MKKEETILTIDMEADGPSPYENSMMSLGAALLTMDKKIIGKWEWKFFPLEGKRQDETTMEFWAKNPEAYQYSTSDQVDAFGVFRDWSVVLEGLKESYDITTVAWPAAYDWQWPNYYFPASGVKNPLGFSAFCISTFIKTINPSKTLKFDAKFDASFNDPEYKHTHKPLDDALEQGMKYLNAVKWWRAQK